MLHLIRFSFFKNKTKLCIANVSLCSLCLTLSKNTPKNKPCKTQVGVWEIFSKSQNIIYVFQAKDKAHLQKLFTHFCSRTANEEEEIAHKLLGEQFRVSYLLISA